MKRKILYILVAIAVFFFVDCITLLFIERKEEIVVDGIEQLYEAYKHLLMIDDNAEVKEVCMGSADVGAFRYFGVRPDKDVDDIMEIISRDNWERDICQKSKKETNESSQPIS